jgi:hypothetical protein
VGATIILIAAGCWRKQGKPKVKKKDSESQERSGQLEVSNAAVGSGMELLLMAMHFRIWITDTAAACDSMPSFVGGVNAKTDQDGVTFGDGKEQQSGCF